ncbi:hypothetical protein ACX52_2107 [Yersinia pestis]|nr:hypothetical protein ACX52_2107 [Yersinia pestis]
MDVIHTAFCFQDIHVFPFRTVFLKYCQSLCVFPCRTPAFGTSAQKLYDIYSSIGCALSSFHPSLGPPFDFLLNICSCQTANCFNKSKGVFITDPKLKALLNPQPSWGFSGHSKRAIINIALLYRAGLQHLSVCCIRLQSPYAIFSSRSFQADVHVQQTHRTDRPVLVRWTCSHRPANGRE